MASRQTSTTALLPSNNFSENSPHGFCRYYQDMKTFILGLLISSYSFAFTEVHCPAKGRDMMVADPAIVDNGDSLLIMGTGDILKYKNLESLTRGDVPEKEHLKLFKEITINKRKVVIHMAPWELPWDLQFYEIDGVKYLYGGVMSPLPDLNDARWPEENISRRIKVATYDPDFKGWVFQERPVFGKIDHKNWKGHSYGQQIIKDGSELYMFHEEISRDGITELFVRKMISPTKAGPAKKIAGIEDLSLESTKRVDGGHLLEGPRYTKTKVNGKPVHLVFFSTGDFPTKNYATRVAYSFESIEGPYKVIDQDITESAEDQGLYGVGRAFPFRHQNKDWIIFHGAKDIPGVDHTKWPANLDNFRRCLFAGEITLQLKDNKLSIRLN